MTRRIPIQIFIMLVGSIALSACDARSLLRRVQKTEPVKVAACDSSDASCPIVHTPDENTLRPRPRKSENTGGPGFVVGVEAETLDTSSAAEKSAALASTELATEKELGRTIASLGDVAQQGFWLKTPLVIAETDGRVVWADDGASVNLRLIPKQGESGAGSQISLAAMRALGIPLTALPELIVFSQ